MRKFFLLWLLLATTSALAQHSNTLSWTWSQGTGGTATGFVVQRAASSTGPFTTICGGVSQPACPTLGTNTYKDTAGLVNGAVWYYQVAATGPGGTSTPTPPLKCVTPVCPAGQHQVCHWVLMVKRCKCVTY